MNEIRKLAAFYAKFWYQDADRVWTLSDNAPPELGLFVRNAPAHVERQAVYFALRRLAVPDEPAVPELRALFAWFANRPAAIARCDDLLAGRQPPKTVGTLLRKAYLDEVVDVSGLVRAFVKTEIDKY